MFQITEARAIALGEGKTCLAIRKLEEKKRDGFR